MPTTPDSLDASIDRLHAIIMQTARLLSLRDPIADMTDMDLSPPIVHTLMWLGIEGPLTMGHLAHRLRTTLPSCTRLVDRMKDMGHVLRERDPHDRRVVLVRLSAKGQRLHDQIREGMRSKLKAFLALMSDSDREQLLAILERLEENLVSRTADAADVQEKAS